MIGQPQVLGLSVGVVIGGLYAWLQLSALRRHELRQKEQGRLPSVAGMVPGSMMRVALLLVALVAVQVIDRDKRIDLMWLMISLAVAYGIPFFWRLWQMYSQRK